MKILLLLLILVPFLGGLSMMVRPIEDTHRRNVYVMCLCSAVSVAAIAMLAVFLPTASATDTVFVRIFGENFSIALHIDGLRSEEHTPECGVCGDCGNSLAGHKPLCL